MATAVCIWTWLGDAWELTSNGCGCCGSACAKPEAAGTYIGQQVTTACEVVEVVVALGCTWTWLGDGWDLTKDNCPPGSTCSSPSSPGSYIGQKVSTPCEGVVNPLPL